MITNDVVVAILSSGDIYCYSYCIHFHSWWSIWSITTWGCSSTKCSRWFYYLLFRSEDIHLCYCVRLQTFAQIDCSARFGRMMNSHFVIVIW